MLAILGAALFCCGCTSSGSEVSPVGDQADLTITDATGRTVTVPENVETVICSGPGCLRYLTYMQAEDRIIGVDDIEKKDRSRDGRPYALANPQFKDYPLIGEFRGFDDPEKILALQPQVIFKTYGTRGYDPDELQEKTGIPVVVLNYGDLGVHRSDFFNSMTLMGQVLGKEERAQEVIDFFETEIADLDKRTSDIPEDKVPTIYIGGLAHSGSHGFDYTEVTYPPFLFLNTRNVAWDETKGAEEQIKGGNAIAKEKILEWNPEIIFVDLSTLACDEKNSALSQLRTDASYRELSAVKSGEVYGVLPYNWYSQNHGSILADAYYIGSVLYPEKFSDISADKKADEIYTFLVGEPVFDKINTEYDNLGFTKLEV